jgi:hypothetical protein
MLAGLWWEHVLIVAALAPPDPASRPRDTRSCPWLPGLTDGGLPWIMPHQVGSWRVAALPRQALSVADQIKALLANASDQDKAEVRSLFKGSTGRDPARIAMLIDLKKKYQDMAAKDLGMADGSAALASIFLAAWKKQYHHLVNGRRTTEPPWKSGGKGVVKPTWITNGTEGVDYEIEELVGR